MAMCIHKNLVAWHDNVDELVKERKKIATFWLAYIYALDNQPTEAKEAQFSPAKCEVIFQKHEVIFHITIRIENRERLTSLI